MAADQFKLQSFPFKPRVFVLSDISNEPDDAESLVRYLLYSNQFETEGLVAVTSTWMKNKVCPEDMHTIVDGYSEVLDNLNHHAHPDCPYPSVEYWRSIIKPGAANYGMEAVGEDRPLSEGGQLLFDRITTPSEKPLWILIWGGSNTLAQTLLKIQMTYSALEAAELRAKLRVYAISDQDDTGAWIRSTFPDIFYIASIHAWNQYTMAAWSGISGERYFGFDQGGPDFSKFTKEWLKENIQIGPLGSMYPDYAYIPEGDTPTFLYLIQNGLGFPERPEYGSWGGRYQLANIGPSGSKHYVDTVDIVKGQNGATFTSNHATIWRWRDAYQNDFAARMRWTLSPSFASANHHPVLCVNGSFDNAPLFTEVEAGESLVLDATGTYDPDGDSVTFKWWQYLEPSASQWPILLNVAELEISPMNTENTAVVVKLPGSEKGWKLTEKGRILHVILEVTDSGSPSLTSYRRIIIQATYKGSKTLEHAQHE